MSLPYERIRERSGLTQQNVADALGVSRALISYWERGVRPMDARWFRVVGYWDQTVHDLAPLLGFDVPPLPYRAACCGGRHSSSASSTGRRGK
jgi:transcriptional regulator with XRE-family HTH domain